MKKCQVCGFTTTRTCTNRCCYGCHQRYCTPGGNTAPGHNLNLAAARKDYESSPRYCYDPKGRAK